MQPVIITVDDLIRFLLPIFPDVQVEEDFNGEIVIFTGMKVFNDQLGNFIAPLPSALLNGLRNKA